MSHSTPPAWADVPGIELGDNWLPIVCNGSAAQPHEPFETIGIYYDTGPHFLFPDAIPHQWGYLPRPRYGSDGGLLGAYIETTADDQTMKILERSHVLTTQTIATAFDEIGSVVTRCPACTRVSHRVARRDWFAFLAARREDYVSGAAQLPWVDVSMLD